MRIRDAFRILHEIGPGRLVRFAGERLASHRSFRRWVQSLPADAPIERLVAGVLHRGHGEGQLVYALQKESEILALLARLKPLRLRRVLEIGTSAGGTLFLFSRVAAPDALLVSIDLPAGGGYSGLRSRLYRSFARGEQRIVLIQGDSHGKAARRRLAAVLAGERLDFLFIDGDHSAAGVRQDFEDYAPFVRPGGVIALHDIRADEEGLAGEVHRVWPELAARFAGEELVDESGPPGYGIGLLRWPE